MKILYKNRHLPTSLRSVGNLLYPPHKREYEDCEQILKLSLNPTYTPNARQDFSRTSRQKTCPMGRAESEDCQAASATLQHPVNPLPFITRSARLTPLTRAARCKSPLGCLLIAHEVWRLKSSSSANLADSAIFPTDKISASFSKICSPRSRKTQARNAPLIPTGEERSPSLPQCGVDRQHSVAR